MEERGREARRLVGERSEPLRVDWAMVAIVIALAGVVVFGGAIAAGVVLGVRHSTANPDAPRRRARPPDPTLTAAYALRERLGFDPSQAVDVSEEELRANPLAYHGRTIRVTASWHHSFEGSFIGEAFVTAKAPEVKRPYGTHRVTAEGIWFFPRAPRPGPDLPGFGHLGMSWGAFDVYRLSSA